MIIFLYGPDSYRREKKLSDIVRGYRAKHAGANLRRFSIGSDKKSAAEEGAEVRSFMRNGSLFDSGRAAVVCISSYSALTKDDVSWLRETCDSPGASLVLVADTAPTKALSFLVEKPVTFQEFAHLSPDALRSHIVHEAAERGMRLSAAELARLRVLHGADLWGIVTELDMLALSSASTREIPRAKGGDFMALIGLVARGTARDRLPALFRLSEDGDPAKTFNMLSAFVSGEKKRAMADYDIAIKGGLLDYDLALLDLALS